MKKSNWELSASIRKKRSKLKKLNTSIKEKSIEKSILSKEIDKEVDELTSRIKKPRKIDK